ncbi:MAG TPA: TOPRIM nucleotidyl transferase/hydrolase domain-containing protein [Candidatus Saccharimonadales bacterium]|nr:TOPRIM nucleotidyl transferase/hydrolase domain-containing protein [Candidatus Saccharimonadales bacterium]
MPDRNTLFFAHSQTSSQLRLTKQVRCSDAYLHPDFNIIVGDNESGKSTLLESINLALKCQLNRRSAAYELHPYLFNTGCLARFLESQRNGERVPPPEILIELYFKDIPELAELKGTNNSLMEDMPGVSLRICLDDEHFKDEYRDYIANPEALRTIPIEFYEVVWQTFSGRSLDTRSMPIRSSLIDPGSISNTYAANKYILEFTREYLTNKQQVDLAISYRKLRDVFHDDASIVAINKGLTEKNGIVSDKTLSIAMDMTARTGWETGVLPHLDDIPMTLVGKGEQSSIKIKLAMEAEKACEIVLIEEPENHLSHSNLNRLISHLAERSAHKQLIVTTHSSFVLNKLGVDNILMFRGGKAILLSHLSDSTRDYFKKLPGHDTLRMILAERTILVEGPSDELIVQKAFFQKHGKTPLQAGVEVISVNSLAFKRFLEIARLLKINTRVVTDNDKNAAAVNQKYEEFAKEENIRICFSTDDTLYTLEVHLLSLNGRAKLNKIFTKSFPSDDELLDYMIKNKTECALRVLDSPELVAIPKYIQDAIE